MIRKARTQRTEAAVTEPTLSEQIAWLNEHIDVADIAAIRGDLVARVELSILRAIRGSLQRLYAQRSAAGENWLPVRGYEGLYEVSDFGRVRNARGRILGVWPNSQGYMIARLAGPRTTMRVHRMVAEAFISNSAGKPVVNHIDFDRANNKVGNLEWCTQEENLRHSEHRLNRRYWAGKRSPSASLTDDQVREMRRLYATETASWEILGKMFGVSKRAAGRVITGRTYADVQ